MLEHNQMASTPPPVSAEPGYQAPNAWTSPAHQTNHASPLASLLYSGVKRKRSSPQLGSGWPLPVLSDPELELVHEYPQKRHVSEMMASGLHRHMSLTSSEDSLSTGRTTASTPPPTLSNLSGRLRDQGTALRHTSGSRSLASLDNNCQGDDVLMATDSGPAGECGQDQQGVITGQASDGNTSGGGNSVLQEQNGLQQPAMLMSPTAVGAVRVRFTSPTQAANHNHSTSGAGHAPSPSPTAPVPLWPNASEPRTSAGGNAMDPDADAGDQGELSIAEDQQPTGVRPLATRRGAEGLYNRLNTGLVLPPPGPFMNPGIATKVTRANGASRMSANQQQVPAELMPPSPSDARFTFADLRKHALLRSFRQRSEDSAMQVLQDTDLLQQQAQQQSQHAAAQSMAQDGGSAANSPTLGRPPLPPNQAFLGPAASAHVHPNDLLYSPPSSLGASAGGGYGRNSDCGTTPAGPCNSNPFARQWHRGHSPVHRSDSWLDGQSMDSSGSSSSSIEDEVDQNMRRSAHVALEGLPQAEPHPQSLLAVFSGQLQRLQPSMTLNNAPRVLSGTGAKDEPNTALASASLYNTYGHSMHQHQHAAHCVTHPQAQEAISGGMMDTMDAVMAGAGPPGSAGFVGTPAPAFNMDQHVAQMRSSACGSNTALMSIPEAG